MDAWIKEKLENITQEFREGHGTKAVFEASYLSYLDCLVSSRGSESIWDAWIKQCRVRSDPPSALSNWVGRQDLVQELEKLSAQWGVILSTQTEEPEDEALSLFDLLSGVE